MTALKHAFAKAGYSGGRDRVYSRIVEILNKNGGARVATRNKLIEIAKIDSDFMIGMADMCVQIVLSDMKNGGQRNDANNGQVKPAAANGGHEPAAESHSSDASASEEKGRVADAAKASTKSPSSPDSPSKRTARVRAIIETAKAITIFDTYKIRDGRAIGDVPWHELEGLEGANKREAMLLRLIRRHCVPINPLSSVRDAITEETLQRLIQKSAELSDAL